MNVSVKILLLFLFVLVSGVVQAQETAPVEHLYDVDISGGSDYQYLEWSPDSRYFVLRPIDVAGGAAQVYEGATGRLVYDGQFVAWYADGSRMLVAERGGVHAINLETGAMAFTLPHEPLDFAGSHYAFLSWMTWLDGIPQEWVSDEILMFDVSSLNGRVSPDTPNFFVYDSQTGEEIFSLAGVWRPPVYLPGREQVVVSRLPLGLDIYERSTWQVTDSLDGFVVPYARRWWDNDGEHLLVAATTEENDIEPVEGWDYHFWTPGEGLSEPFRGVSESAAWVTMSGSMAWLNGENKMVFYDTDTGRENFSLDYLPDMTGMLYFEGRSARYLLVSKAHDDSTREYAVWDAETNVWTPLGNPGYATVMLRGDAVIVSKYGEFFSVDDLNGGGEKIVFEYDAPYLEFSPDNRFALTLSYMLEGQPRTATLYDIGSGETQVFEVNSDAVSIFWKPDSSGFALMALHADSLSVWQIGE